LVKGLAASYISGVVRLEQRTVIVLAPAKLLTTTERVALKDLLVETKR
jgi:chemotaxis signal transduction protein